MNEIIIFSLNGCSYCKNVKEYFNEKMVPYTDLEINSNREIWNQVVSQTGENVLPTIFVKKEGTDNGPVFVAGKDFKGPEEIYEKIKIYI